MSVQRKEIIGNREIYEISSSGHIRSKDRSGARGSVVQGHDLKERLNSNGYLRVNMHLKGEEKSREYLVHRLVAEAFIPNESNKPYVNHIDGNKLNNSSENLEWCTKSENEKHAWSTGLKADTATKGELHGMHKLTDNDVRYIRSNHKRNGGNISTGEFARKFNVTPQAITDLVSRRTWKHLKEEENDAQDSD